MGRKNQPSVTWGHQKSLKQRKLGREGGLALHLLWVAVFEVGALAIKNQSQTLEYDKTDCQPLTLLSTLWCKAVVRTLTAWAADMWKVRGRGPCNQESTPLSNLTCCYGKTMEDIPVSSLPRQPLSVPVPGWPTQPLWDQWGGICLHRSLLGRVFGKAPRAVAPWCAAALSSRHPGCSRRGVHSPEMGARPRGSREALAPDVKDTYMCLLNVFSRAVSY